MKKYRFSYVWIGLAVFLFIVLPMGYYVNYQSTPGNLDEFTMCLGEKGAVFYGASWCSHCQAQKKLFGKSVSKLPYVECSTPDGNSQTQICIDKKVQSYPTWEFANGERITGEQTLAVLAEKTSCTLPSE